MQLSILLALVAGHIALATRDQTPTIQPALATMLVVCCMFAPVGFSLFQTRLIQSRRFANPQANCDSRTQLAQRWLSLFWLTTVGATLFSCQWIEVVRFSWGMDQVFLLDDLVILGTIVGPLLGVCFFSGTNSQRGNSWAGQRCDVSQWRIRRAHVFDMLRWLIPFFVAPWLLIAAINDLTTESLFEQANTGPARLLSPSQIGFSLITLTLLLIFFPWIIQGIWSTSRIRQTWLENRIKEMAINRGVPLSKIRMWKAGGNVVNACVIGFWAWQRLLFISDGMLARLSFREIEAIVLHELGHFSRRHVAMRLIVLAVPISITCQLSLALQKPSLAEIGSSTIWGMEYGFLLWSIALPALTIVYGIITLGGLSRLLEHDADLFAAFPDGIGVERTELGDSNDAVHLESLVSALNHIFLLDPSVHGRQTWLHPSIQRRIKFLQSVQENPEEGIHFRQQLTKRCYGFFACWLMTHLLIHALLF